MEKDCLLQGQSSCSGFQLLNLQLICPAFFLFLRCLGLRFDLFPSILTCFFLATLHGLQGLSSLTKDQTCAPAVEVHSSNHWTARQFLSQSLLKLQNINYNAKNVSLLSLSHKNLLSLQVCCSPSGFTTTILLFRAEHVKTTNIQDCSALKKDGHICEIYKGTSSTFYRVARGV